jgi:exodeoxyribonuclease VII large subunit
MFFSEPVTVSELTNQIKQSLEENFSQVSVIGEISNFKSHISGHWYFNIKDANAVLSCTMWRGYNNFVFFTPQDGMKVILNGKITVYPPRGNYQLDVRSMKPAGAGELQAAFELLKQKLASEGLFDEERKKEIPRFPEKIGIVTAIDGAAFQDIISVAERRYPVAELVIAPAKVQGSGAAESIVNAINLLNKESDIDVIVIARGGGSIEDLWAFNEEAVARAIFNSEIPVVSGIGHEVDFTIADFVADLRAPTPSAAMELITPGISDIISFVQEFNQRTSQFLADKCNELRFAVLNSINSYGFRLPEDLVRRKAQSLDIITYKIFKNSDHIVNQKKSKVSFLSKLIETHNIQKTLKRGFVLVKQDSKFVMRSADYNPDKEAVLKFFDDELTVIKKN